MVAPSYFESQMAKDSTLTTLTGNAVLNLKNLTLVDENSDPVISFLANTSSLLESISLQDIGSSSLRPVMDVISEYHSKELKSLSIYQNESEWILYGQPIVSVNATGL